MAMSRPTRARGLKLCAYILGYDAQASRPTRARGLKLHHGRYQRSFSRSRPTRARGLKLDSVPHSGRSRPVAPHAGAWIETER